MPQVTVKCDRCKRLIVGWQSTTPLTSTAGFYRILTPGLGWGKFANPGEQIVCDSCMQHDPRYLAVYGVSTRTHAEGADHGGA